MVSSYCFCAKPACRLLSFSLGDVRCLSLGHGHSCHRREVSYFLIIVEFQCSYNFPQSFLTGDLCILTWFPINECGRNSACISHTHFSCRCAFIDLFYGELSCCTLSCLAVQWCISFAHFFPCKDPLPAKKGDVAWMHNCVCRTYQLEQKWIWPIQHSCIGAVPCLT